MNERAIYRDHDAMWKVAQQFGMDKFDFEALWLDFERNNIEHAKQIAEIELAMIARVTR